MFEDKTAPVPEDEDLERLVLRGLREALSPEEAARLDALVADDPARSHRVAELARAWTLAGLAGPETRRGWLSSQASRRGLIAAGAAGVVATSLLAWRELGALPHTYQAPDGGPLRTTLADGTTVVLSRGGRFQVRFDGARRSVRMLSGEALWTVAKDRARPFEVAVAGHRLVVLGTCFNVDPDPAGLRVDLLEGALRVEPGHGGSAVVLKPGERYWDGRSPLVAPADVAASAAWTAGRLVFEDATLAEVAAKVRRHTGKQFDFTDPAVGRLRFSGVLNTDDPQDWRLGLEAVLPVRVAATADGFEIAPKGRPRS
jgi:transmembrane sensor